MDEIHFEPGVDAERPSAPSSDADVEPAMRAYLPETIREYLYCFGKPDPAAFDLVGMADILGDGSSPDGPAVRAARILVKAEDETRLKYARDIIDSLAYAAHESLKAGVDAETSALAKAALRRLCHTASHHVRLHKISEQAMELAMELDGALPPRMPDVVMSLREAEDEMGAKVGRLLVGVWGALPAAERTSHHAALGQLRDAFAWEASEGPTPRHREDAEAKARALERLLEFRVP